MTIATLDEQPPPAEDEPGVWTRTPPQDIPAEQAVLGAMLLSPAAVADVAPILDPGDYYRPQHGVIHEAITGIDADGATPDAITVAARLAATGDLARCGGAPYLHTLISHVPTTANATHYARLVTKAAGLRRLVEAGTKIVQQAYQPDAQASDLAQQALTSLEQVTGVAHGGGPVLVREVVEETVEKIEHPDRIEVIPSGLTDLDLLFPGARAGQLIVVGGRTGVGKSVYGLTVATEAAVRLNFPTLVFSMEMSRLEFTQRLISARARVDLSRILAGTCDEADWSRIAKHLPDIADAPLTIDDSSLLSVADVRARVRRAVRRGLRLVIVDYLQLLAMPRSENRQVAVAEACRALKVLAGEVGVPIYVLAQLNRGPTTRSDKRPQLSDLRESGAIEQDADVVILLHREDAYDPAQSPGECECIVAKQRQGKTGTVNVAFQGRYARLVSMASWGN